jgi:hypothetical protein
MKLPLDRFEFRLLIAAAITVVLLLIAIGIV